MAQLGEITVTLRADFRRFGLSMEIAGILVTLAFGRPWWGRRLYLRLRLAWLRYRLARTALPVADPQP